MKPARKTDVLAALDIGSSKICAIIGEPDERGVSVRGVGVAPTEGYRRGVVTSVSGLVRSIRHALEDAEEEAGLTVDSVFVSAGGLPEPGINTSGKTPVRSRTREVTQEDVYTLTDATRDFQIPEGMVLIHVLPQEFLLDGQAGIVDPRGMMGDQLGVRLHLMLSSAVTVQNVVNVVNRSGLVVEATVMPQVASAMAVLTEDEKELGAVIVDIGGSSTNIAVFLRGSLWHSDSLPMGGHHFTKDISAGLRVSLGEAERLKKEQGCAYAPLVELEELLEVNSIAGNSLRLVSREMLCHVVQARAEELFSLIARKLESWQCRRDLVAGAVITGGMAALSGMDAIGEQVLGMSVRVGVPAEVPGLGERANDPAYATAAGLLHYARHRQRGEAQKMMRPPAATGGLAKASGRMRHWFMQLMA